MGGCGSHSTGMSICFCLCMTAISGKKKSPIIVLNHEHSIIYGSKRGKHTQI